MGENIFKIWGTRNRLLLDDKNEIDLLYVNKDTFCSLHSHETKINRFYVIEGSIRIETEYGRKILVKGESFVVRPSLKHRFVILEDSIILEMAYVEEGRISPSDIIREKSGGRIIDGKEFTIEELKDKGLLEL
jgi:mannose-6-phosphate isomerase-like protein (cupin superfamily)